MEESRHVKSKIAAGYAILIALCLPAVGHLYRQTERLAAPDGSFASFERKRRTIDRLLYHLYRAESCGQAMIAGDPSYDEPYRNGMRTVRGFIDSLRGAAGADDSLQRLRLDSIARLIDEKERRTLRLRREIRAAGTASALERNIAELIEADGTPAAAPHIVRTDTTRIERPKRRLLRRIADIFSPPKEEPGMVVRRETIRTPAAQRDTIAAVLRTLQDRVTADRSDRYARARDEGQRLRYGNRLIDEQILRLLEEFERQASDLMLQRIAAAAETQRRSARTLGAVAIGAVLLVSLFVAILWRDIDRGNRYKRALQRADREKADLLEAREKLMLAITHDIKAPLGAIMGRIDLLQRPAPEEDRRRHLRDMREAARHLHALTESLLDFLRLDMRKVEPQRVAFTPAELFATILRAFEPAARRKGLALRASIARTARQRVAGDAFRIRQIADNLISNALKFTDEGEVHVAVEVERGELLFTVRDTGRGIDPTERAAVFRQFARLRSAQGVAGFGLGLSIVDRLVRLLDGRIAFESSPGAGTRFSVAVPAESPAADDDPDAPADTRPAADDDPDAPADTRPAADDDPDAPADTRPAADDDPDAPADTRPAADDDPDAPADTRPAAQRRLRVLAVDDDPLQLETAAAMCRTAGIETTCCPCPEQAARRVAEEPFDLVVTDIQMPGCDGFAVLAAIRALRPSLPVAAVTARADERPEEYLRRGFAALLHKPFSQDELLQTIRSVADRATGRATTAAQPQEPAEPQKPQEPPPQAQPQEPAEPQRPQEPPPQEPQEPQEPDFGALTAYAEDDPQAARRILRSFAVQTAADRRRLAEALACGDAQAMRAAAHKMRPLLAMLGADDVAATLRRTEAGEPTAPELRRDLERTLVRIDRIVACAADRSRSRSRPQHRPRTEKNPEAT